MGRCLQAFREIREQTLNPEFSLVSIFATGFSALLLNLPVRAARRSKTRRSLQRLDGSSREHLQPTVRATNILVYIDGCFNIGLFNNAGPVAEPRFDYVGRLS